MSVDNMYHKSACLTITSFGAPTDKGALSLHLASLMSSRKKTCLPEALLGLRLSRLRIASSRVQLGQQSVGRHRGEQRPRHVQPRTSGHGRSPVHLVRLVRLGGVSVPMFVLQRRP